VAQTVGVKDETPVFHAHTSSPVTIIPNLAHTEKPVVDQSRQNYLFNAVVWEPGPLPAKAGITQWL